jgi:TonB family protein
MSTHLNKRPLLRSLVLTGIASLALAALGAQQTDPFYLKLLEKSQKAFLAKNYAEACRGFEIAAFGLAQDPTLQAKAYFYAGLSHYYLKDPVKSESFFRQGAELLGDKGLAALDIEESIRPDLEKLMAFFDIAAARPEPPAETPPSQGQEEQAEAVDSPVITQPKDKEPAMKERAGADRKTASSAPVPLDEIKEGDLIPLDMVYTVPVATRKVAAVYPPTATGAKTTGTVTVNALISEKGNVIDTEIIQGIKDAYGFNQAALQAVRRWKFEPATIKGIKVKVWMPISIVFKKPE